MPDPVAHLSVTYPTMDQENERDHSLSNLPPLPINPISEEEEIRRRRLAEQTARKIGGRWSTSKKGSGKIPPAVLTVGSLLLFFGLGQFMWGWAGAAGLTVLIFLHECGHVWAARRLGFPVTGLIFIPFLGAFVTTLRYRRDMESDAFVALMGPVFGAAGSLVCVFLAYATRQAFFLDLAVWNFGINLLNLLPFAPLDGSSIAPVLFAKARRFKGNGVITRTAKIRLSLAYLGLAVFLLVAMYILPSYPFFASAR
jgi:Zn-dependent protease